MGHPRERLHILIKFNLKAHLIFSIIKKLDKPNKTNLKILLKTTSIRGSESSPIKRQGEVNTTLWIGDKKFPGQESIRSLVIGFFSYVGFIQF